MNYWSNDCSKLFTMIRTILIVILITTFGAALKAQNLTATQVQQLVNSRNYSFEVQTIIPQRGGSRHVTTEYFLKVAGDTLTSALPYFGTAYTAPMNPSDAGYEFTSLKFDYTVTPKKKDRYLVSIKTKDRTSNTDFELTVYDNGNASLNVINNDRQPISYEGYINKSK